MDRTNDDKLLNTDINHTHCRGDSTVLGALIESALPAFNEGAALTHQAFEALVQVGLNGAALASVRTLMAPDDPTFGIPFSMALFEAQPGLSKRIAGLASAVRHQATEVSQRMAPPVVAA